jgi:hypothetical protein
MSATMPSTYKIILQTGVTQNRMSANRTSSLSNRVPSIKTTPELGKTPQNINRNKLILFRTAGTLLSRVGDYTGNRILQKNISNAMRWANIGITAAVNPTIGLTMGASELAGNILDYQISAQRSRINRGYKSIISGNTSTSGSRYGGKMR